MLRTYVSYPSTQSPDALFSILKPPTGVFTTTDRRFTTTDRRFTTPDWRFFYTPRRCFPVPFFTFGVFQNADSAFFYPRPVVLNTDQGFPEHRPVFSRGFRHRTQAIPWSSPSLSELPLQASNHEVRLWSEADTGHNSLEIPSSNSGRLTVPNLPHVPTSCKLVTVSIIMFLLAWFV